MRANFIFAALAAILFCTVSVMEIPELLRLANDTSNDFAMTGVQEEARPAAELKQRRADVLQFVASPAPRCQPHARFQTRRIEPRFDNHLASLCVLRT